MIRNLLLVVALAATSSAFAARSAVSLQHLGLQLGSSARQALHIYASTHGKKHRLESNSIELDSLMVEGGDVRSISVSFRIRNHQIKDESKDGAVLHCEGSLVPEEQESDPSDIKWRVEDAGCEV